MRPGVDVARVGTDNNVSVVDGRAVSTTIVNGVNVVGQTVRRRFGRDVQLNPVVIDHGQIFERLAVRFPFARKGVPVHTEDMPSVFFVDDGMAYINQPIVYKRLPVVGRQKIRINLCCGVRSNASQQQYCNTFHRSSRFFNFFFQLRHHEQLPPCTPPAFLSSSKEIAWPVKRCRASPYPKLY